MHKVSLNNYFAFTGKIGGMRAIYLSSPVFNLPEDEFSAVLWHEYGHIQGRHHWFKSISHAIQFLGPMVLASKVLSSEVSRLCELDADIYAARHVDAGCLKSARSHFE